MMSLADKRWLTRVAMPIFNIPRLGIETSPSTKAYPDIWVTLGRLPVITVTETWRRKPVHARRSELVHELLHVKGLKHGRIDGMPFSTYPEEDSYSQWVYSQVRRKYGK